METANFGWALKMLKYGKKLCRAGWNGKGMFIVLVDKDKWGLGSNDFFDNGKIGNKLCSWIGMKTSDNKFVPWLASQTDILAEDWVIIPEIAQANCQG